MGKSFAIILIGLYLGKACKWKVSQNKAPETATDIYHLPSLIFTLDALHPQLVLLLV